MKKMKTRQSLNAISSYIDLKTNNTKKNKNKKQNKNNKNENYREICTFSKQKRENHTLFNVNIIIKIYCLHFLNINHPTQPIADNINIINNNNIPQSI